jgi:hypothetical protein
MRKRTKITFCRSQERERDLHELGLARWWAKDHKQMKLQLEGAVATRQVHAPSMAGRGSEAEEEWGGGCEG